MLMTPRWTYHIEGKLPMISGRLFVHGYVYIPTRGIDLLAVVLLPYLHQSFEAN